MKFKDSVSKDCRYGELADEMWADWDLIWEKSENHYSGDVKFLIGKDDLYIYCEWSYGSCSYCDTWEAQNLADEEIKQEILNSSLQMNYKMYNDWLLRLSGKLSYTNSSVKEILNNVYK